MNSLSCTAQALLNEDMKKAAEEGQLHLDAQTQAEYYKIKEEAKSKTSKLRTDHEALKAGQASSTVYPKSAFRLLHCRCLIQQVAMCAQTHG
jgi:hypothetical protein